jgi:alpha-glucosidase (family GH31 glycosyl hydrolase)
MDKVLDIGIDGFKCDGTDPIAFLLSPLPYSPYAKRYLYRHEYGHLYYGDFYN